MLSPVRLSVVCLSVTLVRPTEPFGTLAIHWHPRKFLQRLSQGNLSVEGVKRKRDVAIWGLSKAISRERCKIGGKLALITNRKSQWAFDSCQSRWPSMTLNGVIAIIVLYFTEFGSFRGCVKVAEDVVVKSSRSLSCLLMSFLLMLVETHNNRLKPPFLLF